MALLVEPEYLRSAVALDIDRRAPIRLVVNAHAERPTNDVNQFSTISSTLASGRTSDLCTSRNADLPTSRQECLFTPREDDYPTSRKTDLSTARQPDLFTSRQDHLFTPGEDGLFTSLKVDLSTSGEDDTSTAGEADLSTRRKVDVSVRTAFGFDSGQHRQSVPDHPRPGRPGSAGKRPAPPEDANPARAPGPARALPIALEQAQRIEEV